MNVLRVISSMNPELGGPSQGLRNLIPELTKLGVNNEVVSLDDSDSFFLGKDSFLIHPLGNAKGPWSFNNQLIPWLHQNFNRFDVIIIHGLWLYHGFAVHRAFTKLKKKNLNTPKLFVMPHGMLDPWFQQAKGREWKAIRNWFYWKLIEKDVINNADGVLFTCEAELILARTSFSPYHPKRELNVGYGIQPPPIHHSEMDARFSMCCKGLEGAPYLLFLSRIHPKKGIDLLLKSYMELKSKGVRLSKLVIAGPGLDSDFGKEMQQLASVDNDIIFPGMLTGDAKWGALYGCEAFVLPSHQENFGIAVAEALACGKPVLISDQVNIWREIEKEEAGIIAPDSVLGVKQQLEKWSMMSLAERRQMGQNAQNTVLKYFTVAEAAKRMKAALEL